MRKRKPDKPCKRCEVVFTRSSNHDLYCGSCKPIAETAKAARGSRTFNQKARLAALKTYSPGGIPVCACCGERITEFLTLDHINNDGYRLRKAGVHGSSVYTWLRRNEYPSGFQVLCFNCNCARGQQKDKICPHRLKSADKKSGVSWALPHELDREPLLTQ